MAYNCLFEKDYIRLYYIFDTSFLREHNKCYLMILKSNLKIGAAGRTTELKISNINHIYFIHLS